MHNPKKLALTLSIVSVTLAFGCGSDSSYFSRGASSQSESANLLSQAQVLSRETGLEPLGEVGIELPLKLVVVEGDGTETDLSSLVDWSSSDLSVATISGNGIVMPRAIGEVTLRAIGPNGQTKEIRILIRPQSHHDTVLDLRPALNDGAGIQETSFSFIDVGSSDLNVLANLQSKRIELGGSRAGQFSDLRNFSPGRIDLLDLEPGLPTPTVSGTPVPSSLRAPEAFIQVSSDPTRVDSQNSARVDAHFSPAEAAKIRRALKLLTVVCSNESNLDEMLQFAFDPAKRLQMYNSLKAANPNKTLRDQNLNQSQLREALLKDFHCEVFDNTRPRSIKENRRFQVALWIAVGGFTLPAAGNSINSGFATVGFNARAIAEDSTFVPPSIVTLKEVNVNKLYLDAKWSTDSSLASTIFHELLHNYGLDHSGSDVYNRNLTSEPLIIALEDAMNYVLNDNSVDEVAVFNNSMTTRRQSAVIEIEGSDIIIIDRTFLEALKQFGTDLGNLAVDAASGIGEGVARAGKALKKLSPKSWF